MKSAYWNMELLNGVVWHIYTFHSFLQTLTMCQTTSGNSICASQNKTEHPFNYLLTQNIVSI